MFLILNGAFGIGKTTVATLLAREVPDARIYNPEDIGFVLRRLPSFVFGPTGKPADYQDMALWRSLIVGGARRAHRHAGTVVVPMAFTNLVYLDAFAGALSADGQVRRLCLVAQPQVVAERLAGRARSEGRAVSQFETRRSAECLAAHADPRFGEPIDATASPAEIVAVIRRRASV